jgi:flagellar hook-associated protein 3 FlgL
MRITQRAVAQTSLQGLNRNLDALGRLQQQLTSGRVLNAPSDSPTGTNRAMQTRTDIAATAQHARNITDGKTLLEAADSALTTMLAQTRKVRDLTVQAANTGAMSAVSRQSIAVEAKQLRQSLLGLANQVLQGRPLFGGVTSGQEAYDADGVYQGRGGTSLEPASPITRQVSDTEAIRVDITGGEAFGDPTVGDDLFAVIGKVVTAIEAGDDDAMATGLDEIDRVMSGMLTALADIGVRAKRVEQAEQLTQERTLSLTSRLAETESVDLPLTIMKLNMQKTGYEAALGATARAIQPSLMDFLR